MNTKLLPPTVGYLEGNGIRVRYLGRGLYLVIGQTTLEIMPAHGLYEFFISFLEG